jgi:hypothetical protein
MNLGPITGFEDFNKEIAHELAARHGIDVEAELQKHLENGSLTTTAVPGHSGVSGYDSTEMERLRNLRKGYSGMSAISGSTSMYGWEKGYSGQSGVSGHSGTSYYPGRSGVSGHSGVKMYPDLPSENMEVKSKMVTKNGVPEIVYYVEAKPIPGEQYVALNERFEPIILSKDEWYRTFHEQNGGGQKETPKKETAQTNKDYEEYLDA